MLLYIHIPFCDSKCFYCGFNSYENLSNLKSAYIEALQIQLKNELRKNTYKFDTVFIGGGTPSTINPILYNEIFNILNPYLNKFVEITTEANPNTATKEWLKAMYELGINRLSFGIQSFDDKKLHFLGRTHTSKTAIKSCENAKKVGFKKINCDIIYGVKNDSFESLKKDIDIINSLGIEHISAYSLTLEKKSAFYKKHDVKIDDEQLSQEIFKYLKDIGFVQYEISNFSKNKNSQSKHNIGYWNYEQYLGIGAGAVGFIDSKRYYAHKNIKEYIKNPLYAKVEKLNKNDMKTEKVLLGFRCFLGVELELFTKTELEKIKTLVENKMLKIKNNRLFSTNFLLADEFALYVLG